MNSTTYSNLGGWDAPQGRAAMPDSKASGAQPTISDRDLSDAVMQECSCGGGGPDDKHTCPACKVYNRLVTLRPNEKGLP